MNIWLSASVERVRLLALPLLLATVMGCSSGSEATQGSAAGTPGQAADVASAQAEDHATARYLVPTITCPGCEARIQASARKDPGVLDVTVDLETKHVTVTYDATMTTPVKIAEAIRKGGDVVELVD